MSSSTALPEWPPAMTPEQHAQLILLSSTYALSHGFTLLPPNSSQPPTSAIPAPLSLLPTPFPRGLYDLAVSLQPIYNALYARIALDWEFLDRVMGGSVSKVDTFQGELWRGWRQVRDELVQPIQLGVFRSDYLLHDSEGTGGMEVKQVEFNTIAASFGALSQRAGEMHRYLHKATNSYYSISPELSNASNFPANQPLKNIATGLAEGWKAYGNDEAVVLFVVQDGERNVFDQKWLEYELLEAHGIQAIRHTFSDLANLAQVDRSSKTLLLPSPLEPDSPPREVAVIYYRSAYTPTDYPSSSEWTTRLLLERSRAIKCPSMALQLAGAKKIQQVLCEPGVLEDFLLSPDRPDVGAGPLTQADVDRLRQTWIGLLPMDNSLLGQEAYTLATTHPERYVLKPQREGGGNNIYRENIPPYLKELEKEPRQAGEPEKKEAYILMELIEPPKGVSNWLVRGGENKARKADVVSELGVYGVMLFGGDDVVNNGAGTLLRTKGRESDEGGVAIGISSIDSPLLV
ncbi:glutathione synthetase [Kwoniella shandongensis]|uniref:Glutathione synthetase n=1 Tax=Kwoniella shandongensis TaxID=1734106 RepID=A0A5M6BQ56_9TREE|nr:glutathione synthetase [Kwoniella shandongensis]KAA5524877.1 glutathione synthetase [Kwoniella shandongensis]